MIQLLLPVCMMKEASGICNSVTSTGVSSLDFPAKILIGYAMKIKMSQLLSFLPETDAPQKRLGKVTKFKMDIEVIWKSSGGEVL